MKIIHFADTHLGIDTIGVIDSESGMPVRVLDVVYGLDQVVKYVEECQPDLVLFAGDSYHRNTPNPTLIDLFSSRIIRMAEIAPVVMVIGNHDMYGDRNKKTALDLFRSMNSKNVYIGNKPINCEPLNGVVVSVMPYPHKTETEEDFLEGVNNLHDKISSYDVKLLLSHCSIEGAVFGSEAVTMTIGHDPIFPLDVVRQLEYDYIALGHIHVFQDLGTRNSTPIVYPGSLIRLDFSDEGKNTGFVEVNIDNYIDYKFVPIKSRSFLTVRIADDEYDPTDLALDWADKHSEELNGAIVRILIAIEDDYQIYVEDILNYYYGFGCLSCVVRIERLREERSIRLPGNSAVSLNEQELMKLWLKDQGYKGKDMRELMKLSEEIMNESNK